MCDVCYPDCREGVEHSRVAVKPSGTGSLSRCGMCRKSLQDMSMTGELTSSRVKTAGTKRPSGAVYGSGISNGHSVVSAFAQTGLTVVIDQSCPRTPVHAPIYMASCWTAMSAAEKPREPSMSRRSWDTSWGCGFRGDHTAPTHIVGRRSREH
ncbi:hypothetical protein P4O66_018405 [Electrophorus voltai]|uniref:Uncharacterized protein n=1 Tax=Electrophorus voltai TaxID=2609070 RepID=A0AAD8YS81_9TELE|nr:hypothetical protein P4O66_018405 [Electrophorus voltai]